jgi:hypothetical protein
MMRVAAREKMNDLRKLLGRDVTVARAARTEVDLSACSPEQITFGPTVEDGG